MKIINLKTGVKNKIYHTKNLCLRTLDTNLICKNVCRNEG